MADKRVKYTYDAGPFCEAGITGKQTSWRKNDSAFVPEADAYLLIASGKFVLSSFADGSDSGALESHMQAHRDIGGVPRQVAVSAIPFVIPPGDGAANGLQFTNSAGAFTLSAAILTNLWNALKGCWIYLQAGFGGSAYPAGWYWAVFSSDAAGILYTDTYTSGTPKRPASPIVFPSNLNGWLTTTTSEITGPNGFFLPSGSMGPSGALKTSWSLAGNATGTKSYFAMVGSTRVLQANTTTSPVSEFITTTRNVGTVQAQNNTRSSGTAPLGIGGTASASVVTPAYQFTSIDTAVDNSLSLSLQISVNTACAILLHSDTTCIYGA